MLCRATGPGIAGTQQPANALQGWTHQDLDVEMGSRGKQAPILCGKGVMIGLITQSPATHEDHPYCPDTIHKCSYGQERKLIVSLIIVTELVNKSL